MKPYTPLPQSEINKLKTPKQFLAFFEAIPEDLWCLGDFKIGSRYCALGHLGARFDWDANCETETPADARLLKLIADIPGINDGDYNKLSWYRGLSIKDRVLTALKRLIAGKPTI